MFHSAILVLRPPLVGAAYPSSRLPLARYLIQVTACGASHLLIVLVLFYSEAYLPLVSVPWC